MKILVLSQDDTPLVAYNLPRTSSNLEIEQYAGRVRDEGVEVIRAAYAVLNLPGTSRSADEDSSLDLPAIHTSVVELNESDKKPQGAPKISKVVVLSQEGIIVEANSPPRMIDWEVEKFATSVREKRIAVLTNAFVVLHPTTNPKKISVDGSLPKVETAIVDLIDFISSRSPKPSPIAFLPADDFDGTDPTDPT